MAILPSTLLGILRWAVSFICTAHCRQKHFWQSSCFPSVFMQPLITAFSYTDDIAQVKTIVSEVAEVLSGEDMQRPKDGGKAAVQQLHRAERRPLCLSRKKYCSGVNLHIAPGQSMLLWAPPGSGKSTIARLIASLWDVKDGAIELCGVDIRTLPLRECTKRIAYVSQDNYLFDLSVMDNIRMGRKGATDAEVIDAAKKCGCHEFIMGLENGYQTVCGASGGHLSGGERQRISIARCHAEGRADRQFSTRQRPIQTRKTRRSSSRHWEGWCGARRCWSLPTGCPPLRTPIRSLLSIKARSKRPARRRSFLASCPHLSNHVGGPHQRQRRRGGGVMLKTLKKFFAFCGVDNRRLFITSIWLGVVSAICSAMRIPAAAIVIQALLERNVTMATLWTSLGIIVISLIITIAINMKATMLQTRAGYRACANKRNRDRRAPALPAYGLVQ